MKIDDLINLGIDAETAGRAWELFEAEIKRFKAQSEELKQETEQIKIDYAVKYALENAGVYSEKAVRAMMNFENIYVENGTVKGVEKEIERVRKECDILFIGGEVPRIISTTLGENGDKIGRVRSAMGI